MSFNMFNPNPNPSNASNLWIGDLDNWMDEKYLKEALDAYGKFYFY